MQSIKELIGGLLAGALLVTIAFPSGLQSLSDTFAALIACFLSIAATSAVLYVARWPRISVELRFSTVSLILVGTLISIGLGIFLWKLTVRLDQVFALGIPVAACLVFLGAGAYFALCYYLLMSYLSANSSESVRERSIYRPLFREANQDGPLPARSRVPLRPEHRRASQRPRR